MITFKANRINNWKFVIIRWLTITIIIFLGAYTLDFLFPGIDFLTTFQKRFYIIFYPILFLIITGSRDRINRIGIDIQNKLIKIETYSLIDGRNIEIYSPGLIRIKSIRKQKLWPFSNPRLEIFVGKNKKYEIEKSKDGSSDETLDNLKNFLNQ